jgi:exopolysaccharide/PEP-CTERM locus tyrosine autokinase
MSKIQEALKEVKANSRRRATEPAKRLAKVVRSDHKYAGHSIVVDHDQLRANGLLAPGADKRRLAEQYRAIKRPLLRNADPSLRSVLPLGNLIMVASALSGEGKSFTSVNLCLSIARERDWSVVLVDADSSKPHLTRQFSAENELGLMDLLCDPGLKFEDIVMPTDIDSLSFLPAGNHDIDSSELLASRAMRELCEELSSAGAGRIILFDSSPLILTTEAVALADQVGQILMVVRANSTPQETVLAALETIDPDKATNCVLNRATGVDIAEGYGYYGIYGDSPPSVES